MGKLVLGIADGMMKADGRPRYEAKDVKVVLFQREPQEIEAVGGSRPLQSGSRHAANITDHSRRTNRIAMRRVVVTGLGVVSSIGSNKAEVIDSLKSGRSGVEFCETYAEMGFRSPVHGSLKNDLEAHVVSKEIGSGHV